jgi:threonine dehydratase
MMAKLPKDVLEKGVICSSAGNHAQGVAMSAKRLNCNAVIAMPVTTPDIKVFIYSLFHKLFVSDHV